MLRKISKDGGFDFQTEDMFVDKELKEEAERAVDRHTQRPPDQMEHDRNSYALGTCRRSASQADWQDRDAYLFPRL